MTFLLVITVLFIWHSLWNMMINNGLQGRQVYLEQVVVSFSVALLLEWINEYNFWLSAFIAIFISLFYYVNIIYIRFFGTIISKLQIKQFFKARKLSSVNQVMVLKGAQKLIKAKDMLYLIGLCAVIMVLFFSQPSGASAVQMRWSLLNIMLLWIIMTTLVHWKSLRAGTYVQHQFGLLFAFLTSSRSHKHGSSYVPMNSDDFELPQSKRIEQDQWFGKFKGKNVIMIQLESFQQFVIHHEAEGQEITPFLNKLARENIEFTDIFSQFGMGHTADVELAVLQSLYPHKHEIVNYTHFDKNFYGVPHIFKDAGYATAAYHGYKGDFYNRRTMMNAYGFESFSSEEDYVFTEKATFGLSDLSFVEQTVQKLKTLKQPFFSFMITLTSHFPFKLELEKQALNFHSLPANLADYYQSLNYTDRAIEQLFDHLQREGLLEDTVIFLYGDHEGVTHESMPDLYRHLKMTTDPAQSYIQGVSMAKVPFIIYDKGLTEPISYESNVCGSTMDIGQTALHLLGLPPIPYGYGENLFAKDEDIPVTLALYPQGSYVSTSKIFIFSEQGGILYNRTSRNVGHKSEQDVTDSQYCSEQIQESQYMLMNNILSDVKESTDSTRTMLKFSPQFERVMDEVDEDALFFPLSLAMEEHYFDALNSDKSSLSAIESTYSERLKKEIRFHTFFDPYQNDKMIYFEDTGYFSELQKAQYDIQAYNGNRFSEYLSELPDHVLIVISARDEAANQFNNFVCQEMKSFGITLLNQSKYRHSYVNLIYKNKGYLSLLEQVSVDPIKIDLLVGNVVLGVVLPFSIEVLSRGEKTGSSISSILIDGQERSQNRRGLNVAVIDMNTTKTKESFRVDSCVTMYLDQTIYMAKKRNVGGGE